MDAPFPIHTEIEKPTDSHLLTEWLYLINSFTCNFNKNKQGNSPKNSHFRIQIYASVKWLLDRNQRTILNCQNLTTQKYRFDNTKVPKKSHKISID